MQLQGATDLERKIHETILRAEAELPAGELETTIVVALSDAGNELQRLREQLRVASNALEELSCAVDAVQKDAAEVARRINHAEALAEACEEVLKVVDDAYKATGFIRFAKTSDQRMKIEAALAAYRKGEA